MKNIIKEELERIAGENDGLLLPEQVVELARDELSPLHPHFEWDDTAAAHRYRIEQARGLIQVFVNVTEIPGEVVRAFVSLSSDRKQGGGYRLMVDVINDKDHLAQMLADAKAELEIFRKKYAILSQFSEIEEVLQAITNPKLRKTA